MNVWGYFCKNYTKGAIHMNKKKASKADERLNESDQKKNEEFINVFDYFENANIRNREAFIELLNYTIKNKK